MLWLLLPFVLVLLDLQSIICKPQYTQFRRMPGHCVCFTVGKLSNFHTMLGPRRMQLFSIFCAVFTMLRQIANIPTSHAVGMALSRASYDFCTQTTFEGFARFCCFVVASQWFYVWLCCRIAKIYHSISCSSFSHLVGFYIDIHHCGKCIASSITIRIRLCSCGFIMYSNHFWQCSSFKTQCKQKKL